MSRIELPSPLAQLTVIEGDDSTADDNEPISLDLMTAVYTFSRLGANGQPLFQSALGTAPTRWKSGAYLDRSPTNARSAAPMKPGRASNVLHERLRSFGNSFAIE
jgi:hypothetical protein